MTFASSLYFLAMCVRCVLLLADFLVNCSLKRFRLTCALQVVIHHRLQSYIQFWPQASRWLLGLQVDFLHSSPRSFCLDALGCIAKLFIHPGSNLYPLCINPITLSPMPRHLVPQCFCSSRSCSSSISATTAPNGSGNTASNAITLVKRASSHAGHFS